jgi:hypothetical protein
MEDTFEKWWAGQDFGRTYDAWENPTTTMISIKNMVRKAFEAGRTEGEEAGRSEQIPCMCTGDNRYYR